jgi:hypothetical protein
VTADPRSSDELTLDATPRLDDAIAIVEVGDESVLYDETTGALHQLDRVGTIVCQLFDGSTSIRAMAGELADAFGADRDVVARDVLEMARTLGRAGVLAGIAGEELPGARPDAAVHAPGPEPRYLPSPPST